MCERETVFGWSENTQFLAAIILVSESLHNAKQTLQTHGVPDTV